MLIICPYAPVSEVSTSDLEEWSKACEHWLWWRGKPSPSRSWIRRCKKEPWMRVLSTRTFYGFHGKDIEAWWISLAADSLASRSQFPAPENLLKTLDTSGPISPKESLFADQDSASSKMSTVSRPQNLPATTRFSTMSLATWKKWVTEQRQDALARRKSARLTYASDGSSWPTPDVTMRPHEGNVRLLRKGVEKGMEKAEADAMLGRDISKPQGKLPAWPTASARDWKDTPGMSVTRADRPGKARSADQLARAVYNDGPQDPEKNKKNGSLQERLNPDWVDTLMGFPIGWTDLEL